MSPKTGRPPKADTKKKQLTIRIGDASASKLQSCSEMMKTSRTEVIEYGISVVYDQLKEKK